LIGPDGATHIETDRFCYRNLEEHSKSKSIQFSTSLILDPSNVAYGSMLPGSLSFNYHEDECDGKTKATVGNGDPINFHDSDGRFASAARKGLQDNLLMPARISMGATTSLGSAT
jgi:hypothetical protein